MAQVAQTMQQQIDHLLKRSLAEWGELPEVEAAIDSWDLIEQIVFVEEWTLAEERLLQLARYAKTGNFSDEQWRRHRDLERLIARNRPIIERLRAS